MVACGERLLGISPSQYRSLWARGRQAIGLPRRYTPNGVCRGGATVLFQHAGSFNTVADRGRWASLAASRMYVKTALAEIAADDQLDAIHRRMRVFAKYLHDIPA